MEEDHELQHQREELQLLPTPHYSAIASSSSQMNFDYPFESGGAATGVDLQLSISCLSRTAFRNSPHHQPPPFLDSGSSVKALKWHASEQIRLASIEKAYAERVRELTRREMELAQSEFARARHIWERAKEEVDKAERIKEITCRSCRQRFRPRLN